MNNNNSPKTQVLYTPCPAEEFSGRFNERKKLLEIIFQARHQGQMVMVSGARGSGKSSFLNWAEYEIQNKPGGLESPAIKREFPETPGMIFVVYKDILTELKGHQKLDWFRKTLNKPKVQKSIEVLLALLDKGSTLAGPAKIGIDAGKAAAKEFLPRQPVEPSQLFASFLAVLRSLGSELIKNNQFIAIICDDAQWSYGDDFLLLKDLIPRLPQGIAFIIAFRLESESMGKYEKLRGELDRFGFSEIRLSEMRAEEIKDFAKLRYDFSIDNLTAKFLSENIGDPLCLVSCFNLLIRDKLEPNIVNFKKVLPKAVEPARCIYSELDPQRKRRVDSLCILHPPLALSLIACMLNIKEDGIAELQDELNQSIVFSRLEKESYDFAHASLREYRRNELPEHLKIRLHSKAAECLETLKDRFPDKWFVDISLAEHLFFGQNYKKALELNIHLGDKLYDLFDFNLALQLTKRAKTCAEKTNNKQMVAAALHQKGLILQYMFKFPNSLDAYNKSLAISREIGDRAGEAITLHQMGMVYELTNRFKKALDYYNQSLVIEREIGKRAGEAITLHQMGMVYELTNRFEKALDYYNQSLVIEREIGKRAGEAQTLHQFGRVYQLKKIYKKALDYYNQSLEIKREIGDRAGEAKTMHQIGIVYELTNRFEKAMDYYKQSLEIKREIGDRAGESQTLHQMGMVYEETNRFKEAMDYYNQSLVIEREIGDRAGEAQTLHQMGRVNEETNRFKEAMDYYNQSLTIEREIGNKPGEEVSLRTIKVLKEKMHKKK